MGVENFIFWSKVGSGFGEMGGTPPPRIARSTPLWESEGQVWTETDQSPLQSMVGGDFFP